MKTMDEPREGGPERAPHPQQFQAKYTLHTTKVHLDEGGHIVDVTEVFAVLRDCLRVSPPPDLRARIILQIRQQSGGRDCCQGD